MAPTLETKTGRPLALDAADPDAINAAFDAAAADVTPDTAAPPLRTEPAEPAGPKKRGRPSNAERARTVKAVPAAAAAAVPLTDVDRTRGVKGLAQVGAGLLFMYGNATGRAAYIADSMTVLNHADQAADAMVQLAKADPKAAAVLDKLCAAGPTAAIVTVGISVSLQIVRNHRPALALPGTVPPEDLFPKEDNGSPVAAAA